MSGMIGIPIVILAGGKSRRMGRDKLSMTLGGKTLLESAIERFSQEFENAYISVAGGNKYGGVSARRITDILPGAGPMSGLHAALSTLDCEGVFLAAADLPYASAAAAKRIIELKDGKEACIIRLPDGKIEPLFGFYGKSLLRLCEERIKSGDYRMSELICRADTRFAAPDELGALWNDRLLFNMNYMTDYEKAKSKEEPFVCGR